MLRISLSIDENIALLLSAIRYERMETMDMELAKFFRHRSEGSFLQDIYRLSASMDMNAQLEVMPESNSMILQLHPRVDFVKPMLQQIVDAFLCAKDSQGNVSIERFSAGLSERALEGIKEYVREHGLEGQNDSK